MEKRRRHIDPFCLAVALTCVLPSSFVFAKGSVGDLENENCSYNGIKLDRAAMPDTKGRTNEIPPDFTGVVVCVDPQTKRMYETYRVVKGERTGETRVYDRQNGRLTEVTSYKSGKRNGIVRKYDWNTGKLTMEFAVRDGVPDGVQRQYYSDTGTLERITWVSKDRSGSATDITFNKKGQLMSLTCGDQVLIGTDARWCGRDGKVGDVTLYSSEGVVSRREQMLNGKLHGLQQQFRDDGSVMSETRYENDKRMEEKQFRAGERKPTYASARAGDSEMEVSYFPESKKKQHVIARKHGKVVKEFEYFANGQLAKERVAEGERFHVREFTDRGICIVDGAYREPLLGSWGWYGLVPDGAVKSFTSEGHLVEEEHFVSGERDGIQKSYDAETPSLLLRRAYYEKGRLKWSEDFIQKTHQTMRREYAEDGSIKNEKLVAGISRDI